MDYTSSFFFFQTSWKKKKKVGPYCSASRAGCENNSPLKEPKSRQNTPGHESLEDQWMVKDWVCESRVLSGAEFTGRSDAVCQRCYWTLIIWATVSSAATCDVSVCSMERQKTILISFVWGQKLNAMKMQQQFFFVFFFPVKIFLETPLRTWPSIASSSLVFGEKKRPPSPRLRCMAWRWRDSCRYFCQRLKAENHLHYCKIQVQVAEIISWWKNGKRPASIWRTQAGTGTDPPLFGDLALSLQLGSSLPPLQDTVVLFGVDVQRFLFEHLSPRQRDSLHSGNCAASGNHLTKTKRGNKKWREREGVFETCVICCLYMQFLCEQWKCMSCSECMT